MSSLHIAGMLAAIALIVGMAIWSGTKAKGAANDNSAGVVAGIIMGTQLTIIIPAIVMVLYVVFGGTKGAGIVGIVKLVLLYVSMVVCGVLALTLAGGLPQMVELVKGFCADTGVNFFSPFARGVGTDLGAGLSLLVGVLTTQTYAQGVISGKSDGAAKTGALLSAVLIPIIGIFGILVGLYMRSVTDPATFMAKTALTQFVLDNLPPAFGGVVPGALFIASVGTGAGLALGISTILTNDVIKRFTHAFDDAKKADLLSKALIVIVLAGACLLSTGNLGDIIMNFSFMSMGLRGAVIFVPMTFALFAKGCVKSVFALASVIAGPLAVLVGNLIGLPFGPLFLGLVVNLAIMGIGFAVGNEQLERQSVLAESAPAQKKGA